MHGPTLTTDEIAALVTRQVAVNRALGASLDRAARIVAERHHISHPDVTRLLLQHRRTEQARDTRASAVA